jgi:hypothetical protein
LLGGDREMNIYATAVADVMDLQTTALTRQWLSGDHIGTPTDTNATMAQQQRYGVFCAIVA